MPQVSTVLDRRYRLDRLIGRGGMADVYRAHDQRLDRAVAVKVLREIEHERRFEVEVQTLASLQHPNLVRLLDAGSDGGELFLVMELLDGASVHELLARGPIEPERVATLGREAAAALDYIHRFGIVHRDVKPSNLMFDDRGTLRLADFGIVRLADGAALTATHQTIGTMAYLAPEQLRGHEIGPSADVYALGLVLLECLTGSRAFGGPPAEAGAARLTRDPEIPSSLPAPWPSLLQAMTARDPTLRPTAGEVRDRLDGPTAASSGESTAAMSTAVLPAAAVAAAAATVMTPAVDASPAEIESIPIDSTPNPTGRRSRRPLAAVAGGSALVAVVAAGLWVAIADDPARAPATTVTTSAASTVPPRPSTTPTTAVPVTTVPETAPPPVADDDDSGPGNGNGNGKGKGKGNEKGNGASDDEGGED